MEKQLLIIGKYEKEKNGVKYYNLETLKLVRKKDGSNAILKNFINGKGNSFIINVSKLEYEKYLVGDVVSYSCVVNEFERTEYLVDKLIKNIFGK